MSALLPTSGAKQRAAACAILTSLVGVGAAVAPAHGQGVSLRLDAAIPNFAPSPAMGWLKAGAGDEFLPPESGPGPVVSDPTQRFTGSFILTTGNAKPFKIADLSNPILQPWVVERLRKTNEEALAGKVGFTARSRCWPHGVPGFLLYPVHPIFFIQTPKEVVMTWGQVFQLRHVYLNVPHSNDPKPSWYGESVGHYENGDTLVVDTIGFNDKTYIDNFRTPHTEKLHVVERFRMIDDGKTLEANIRVEDPGAFTMQWNAVQRWRRVQQGPMYERACAENPFDLHIQDTEPVPHADRPDF